MPYPINMANSQTKVNVYSVEEISKFGGVPGPQGDKGDDGRGILSITRTVGDGSPGTTDTYTIAYSDSTTSTFQVHNGVDGAGDGSYYEPLTNGDAENPEILFFNGDIVMGEVK